MPALMGVTFALMLISTAPVAAEPPVAAEAEKLLKEIDAIKLPSFSEAKRGDKSYEQTFARTRRDLVEKRNELILQLYKVDPGHPRVAALMVRRWNSIEPVGPAGEALFHEIDEVTEATSNGRLRLDGLYVKAQSRIYQGMNSTTPDLTLVDEFMRLAPNDERGPKLLYMAYTTTKDEKTKVTLEQRLLSQFADTPFAAAADSARRQRLAVGKPFLLEFTDAIGGSKVSIKELKGKVVVVIFWATWCAPCVAEVPMMKKLFGEYHDQGVEFIGVSLDEPRAKGGLEKLKSFVKANAIRWPQYYQGRGWASDFSKLCGVNSIPTVFVIDVDGRLHGVVASGKLPTVLSELLKKKAARAAKSIKTK